MRIWIISSVDGHCAAGCRLTGAVQNLDAQVAASEEPQIKDRVLVALNRNANAIEIAGYGISRGQQITTRGEDFSKFIVTILICPDRYIGERPAAERHANACSHQRCAIRLINVALNLAGQRADKD